MTRRPRRDANWRLRALHAAARTRGLSHEDLHETIWVTYQKRSLKELTTEEALDLLDGLNGKQRGSFSYGRRQAMSFHGRKDHDRSRGEEYLVNDRERKMLREAASLRGWDDETLARFTERQVGHEIRTMADFNKVFWPIKSMNRRDGLCR